MGGDPERIAADPTGHGGRDPKPPRPDAPDRDGRRVVSGRVTELLYDCFGAFEGFVVEDCERRHRFRACERGIERVVRRACRHRSRISVIAIAAAAPAKAVGTDPDIRERLLEGLSRARGESPQPGPQTPVALARPGTRPERETAVAKDTRILKIIVHCCG